jgi:hypothetical protein
LLCERSEAIQSASAGRFWIASIASLTLQSGRCLPLIVCSAHRNKPSRNREHTTLHARDKRVQLFLLVNAAVAEAEFRYTAQYSAG